MRGRNTGYVVLSGSAESLKKASGVGIAAAAKTLGIVKITAVNFGGKLGPYQIHLVDALKSVT